MSWKLSKKEEKEIKKLINKLKDKDENVFVIGKTEALAELGEKAIPALIGALKDEAGFVRSSAVWALSRMGEKAVPALKEAKKSDKKIVREQAIIALETISAKLGYRNHKEYLRATRTEEERKAETIGEKIEELDSLNLQIRKVAAYKLGEMQAKEAIEPLSKILDKRRENTWLRAFAVWALGEIGSDKALRILKIIEKPKPLVGYVIKGYLLKLDEKYQNEISIEEDKKRTEKERERIEDCQRLLKEEYDRIILLEPRESWWGRLKPAVRELIKGALSALLGALIGGVIGWFL